MHKVWQASDIQRHKQHIQDWILYNNKSVVPVTVLRQVFAGLVKHCESLGYHWYANESDTICIAMPYLSGMKCKMQRKSITEMYSYLLIHEVT